MNSVALPAQATMTPKLSAEADLVRQAARGDAEAFGEVLRRHRAPAWRLAQAVAADRESALTAFADGFARAVRASRVSRRAGAAFRPQVLASVYRCAADLAYDRHAGPVSAPRRPAGVGVRAALASAAFRSLPERWRAALWLTDIEGYDNQLVAAVLGVPAGVADQLVTRARKGLAGRFAQARSEVPADVADLLRQSAIAAPADLAEVAASRWAAGGTDRLSALAPAAAWMQEHAARPLSVAAGTLIGLGMIGLGVVSGGGAVHSQLGAAGSGSVSGSVPVSTCTGAPCPAQVNGTGGTGAASFNSAFNRLTALSNPAAGGGAGGGQAALAAAPAAGPGVPGANPSTPSTPSTPTGPGAPSKPGAPGPGTSGGSTYGIPGVATLSLSNGSASVNLLNGTAKATTGSCGIQVSVAGAGGAGQGCSSGSAGSGSSNPLSSLVSGAGSAVSSVTSSVVAPVAKPVSGTATGIVSGVGSTLGQATSSVSKLTGGL